MPGPLVRLGWSGGRGQPVVCALALGEGRAVVDRGADQRVTKADHVADGDQLPGLSRGRRLAAESEVSARPPQQAWVTGRVGGRGQQQGLGVARQSLDLPQVTLLKL